LLLCGEGKKSEKKSSNALSQQQRGENKIKQTSCGQGREKVNN